MTSKDGLRWLWSTTAAFGPVHAVAVTVLSGRPVAVTGGGDGTVRLWDLNARSPLGDPLTGHTGPVQAVAVTTLAGRPVAITGSEDGTVRLWDLNGRTTLGDPLTGHTGPVQAVAVTTLEGRPVAVTGSDDRTVRVWDLTTRTALGDPLTGHTGWVQAVAVAMLEGRPVAVTGSEDGTVRVWDLVTRAALGDPLTGHTGWVQAVAVTRLDGRPVAVTGDDRTVRVWDLTTRTALGDPLTGHTGPVLAMAVTLLGGRPVAVTGGDGTVQLWDLDARTPLGDPLAGHAGSVLAVAVTVLGGRPVAVTGGGDGTVQLRDLATRTGPGDPLTGHTGLVQAVAVLGGRPVAITGGSDGSARLWDLNARTALGKPLTGHTGSVQAVAVTLLGGRPVAVTSGSDATVRLWDLNARTGLGDPLTGHTGSVLAVAVTRLGGRLVAVTGSGDRTVRLWDLTSRTALGDPLTGHTGSVQAVAVTTLDGRPVAVTGSGDRTVRLWDLTSRTALGDPLTGHTGPVQAVAVTTLDGRPVAITGSGDRTVRLWDLNARRPLADRSAHRRGVTSVAVVVDGVASEQLLSVGGDGQLRVWSLREFMAARQNGVDTVFLGENTGTRDELSREGLTAHLAQRLVQLTTGPRSPNEATSDLTGTGIVHLDGRWGAGKSTLVELMLATRSRELRQPVVVRYDAWRQAAIAPEWWSLAAEIRRAVRGSRALPTRWVMTAAEVTRRVGRSTSTWSAVLIAAAAAAGGQWIAKSGASVPEQVKAVADVLGSAGAVLAVAFVLARGLFWSAPVLGRLHVRTDDNPLGEISSIVGQLRRWSPHHGRPQALDWALTAWLAVTAAMAAWWPATVDGFDRLAADQRNLGRSASAAGLALVLLVIGYRSRRRHPDRPAGTADLSERPAPEPTARGRSRRWPLSRAALRLLLEAALATALVWVTGPAWSALARTWAGAVPSWRTGWIAAGVAGLLGYVAALAWLSHRRPRRMVLLIIDDLDRCAGDRVVRLLETVHTVLRERARPRFLRRWRDPAPFAVLVLASGAWIRAAFSKQYESFAHNRAEDVHDLGADFLQKVFDHSVLVPELTPAQTEDLIHHVAGSPYHVSAQLRAVADAGQPGGLPPDGRFRPDSTIPAADGREHLDAAEAAGLPDTAVTPTPPTTPAPAPLPDAASTPAAASRSLSVEADQARRQAAADTRAAQDDLGVESEILITHLLTNYAAILPANPRMIIRVASAWAMLRAVARSLHLEVDQEPASELLVRAAVIWVRFPVLVDELLDSDRPPVTDPTDVGCPVRWRRSDVQQVLTMRNGRPVDIEHLARSYGRTFAPAVPEPPGTQAGPPAPGADEAAGQPTIDVDAAVNGAVRRGSGPGKSRSAP